MSRSSLLSFVTMIEAPAQECMRQSLSTAFHLRTMTAQQEKLLSSHHDEYLGLNDEVLWESRHFGFRVHSRHKIVELSIQGDSGRFIDEQISGPFESFSHLHEFHQQGQTCVMRDEIRYTLKYGLLGRLFNRIFFHSYLTTLIEHRNRLLKTELERVV